MLNGLTHHFKSSCLRLGAERFVSKPKTVDSIIFLLNVVMHKTGCQGCFRPVLSKETGKSYLSNHSILNPFKPNGSPHCYQLDRSAPFLGLYRGI